MYVTLFPAIIAGILNMIWCKLPICNVLHIPMDNGKNFLDHKRLFGDNKTWKGFLGYILINMFISVLWGMICYDTKLNSLNFFYHSHDA